MAALHTITIDLDEIQARAEAVSHVRLNRNTTPEEEMHAAIYNLERAIDECRLAEYALKVEQQKADQMMAETGDETGDTGEDGPFERQISVFRQYADTFTRRITAIARVLEDRRDAPTPPETT
ncbi:MAG: hypothetical protein H0X37_11790 [Herpetosiphonaceae bacterium]|nr:hypothetical protein [Herpetosiphonaceae bacterium]